MHVRFWLLVSMCLIPLAAGAVDFSEYDMLPRTQRLAFDHDKLYFYVTLTQPKHTDVWFAFDRKSRELNELPAAPSAPGLKLVPATYDADHTRLITSDDIRYAAKVPDCEEDTSYDSTLEEDDQPPIHLHGLLPDCVGLGTAEHFGAYLLVGGAQDGDYPSVVSPVLALDFQSHKLVKSFDFAASIIRVDPYASQVWLVGPSGIAMLDASLDVKVQKYFYFGFRPGDHALALLLSDTLRKDDALAVAGDDLHVPDWQAWYQAVSALPMAARDSFDLYTFEMSSPGMLYGSYQAKDLNSLVPFFVDALSREGDPNRVNFIMGNLCRFDDPRGTDYMNKQISAGSPQSAAAGRCLQGRMELDRKTIGAKP